MKQREDDRWKFKDTTKCIQKQGHLTLNILYCINTNISYHPHLLARYSTLQIPGPHGHVYHPGPSCQGCGGPSLYRAVKNTINNWSGWWTARNNVSSGSTHSTFPRTHIYTSKTHSLIIIFYRIICILAPPHPKVSNSTQPYPKLNSIPSYSQILHHILCTSHLQQKQYSP